MVLYISCGNLANTGYKEDYTEGIGFQQLMESPKVGGEVKNYVR